MKTTLSLVITFCITLNSLAYEFRSHNNKYTVKATPISVDIEKGVIILRKDENKKNITVKLDKLHPEDSNLLQQWATTQQNYAIINNRLYLLHKPTVMVSDENSFYWSMGSVISIPKKNITIFKKLDEYILCDFNVFVDVDKQMHLFVGCVVGETADSLMKQPEVVHFVSIATQRLISQDNEISRATVLMLLNKVKLGISFDEFVSIKQREKK